MDAIRLRRALAGQRAYCEARSPFYAEVLRELEADPHAAWLEAAAQAWRARRFAVDWEAAHLLLAALHYWVLRGEPELAALYPSCGGRGGDPRGAVRRFLDAAPAEFWQQLAGATVQTNEVGRSAAWMLAGADAFAARRMPYHLVELGASAGLNLVGDRVPQVCRLVGGDGGEPPGWNRPQPVLTRTGLDLCPRQLADAQDCLWVKACVWADDLARLERLELATSIFLRMQREPDGPRLERCSFADAPAWLLRHRPAEAGRGLLVFNAIGTVYLDEAGYQTLVRGMRRVLAAWQGRAVWVEYERPRDRPGAALEVKVHRMVAGRLQSCVLARGAPRPLELHITGHWGFMGEGETLMR